MKNPCSPQQAPSAGGGLWDYVSPTRLNTWLQCPLKFRLKYVDGISEPAKPAVFLGKLVHQALAHYYHHLKIGVTLTSPELQQWLTQFGPQAMAAEGIEFSSAVEADALQKQARELVLAYLSNRPPDEPRVLAVEQSLKTALVDPFTGEDLGLPLLGILDLVLEGAAGPVIVDFKTAARSGQPLEIQHEVQLSAYSYLLRQTSQVIESELQLRTLIKTRVPQVQVHRYEPRTEVHFRRFFAVVRAYLDDLDSGRFVYRPGFNCAACEYRPTACCSWSGEPVPVGGRRSA